MIRNDGVRASTRWRGAVGGITVMGAMALTGCGDSASDPCVLDGEVIAENINRLEVLSFAPMEIGDGVEACNYNAQIAATGTPVTVSVARYSEADLGQSLFDSLPAKGNGGSYDYNGQEVAVGGDQAAVNIDGTWYAALWQHDNGSNNGSAAAGILELLIDQEANS